MRLPSRLTIILVILLVLMILTLGLSSFTITKYVGSYNETFTVNPGVNLINVSWPGTLEVSGNVPEGVIIYPLSYTEYLIYIRQHKIYTSTCLKGNSTVVTQNVLFLLIKNFNEKTVTIKLYVKRYIIKRPYALISILSYVLCVIFICLIFIKIWRGLENLTPSTNPEAYNYVNNH